MSTTKKTRSEESSIQKLGEKNKDMVKLVSYM